jgi:hypothetical protein
MFLLEWHEFPLALLQEKKPDDSSHLYVVEITHVA